MMIDTVPKKPRAPKEPKAPKARKPRPPKAPKEPKAPKADITYVGVIHYHDPIEPTQPPLVAVYSETIEDVVPPKIKRRSKIDPLARSMAKLWI